MPPAAANWLVNDRSLVPKYRDYAQHIVVADENFLPTMFRNSPFCSHHVASNLVHVQVIRRNLPGFYHIAGFFYPERVSEGICGEGWGVVAGVGN